MGVRWGVLGGWESAGGVVAVFVGFEVPILLVRRRLYRMLFCNVIQSEASAGHILGQGKRG